MEDFLFWAGTTGVSLLIGIVGYLWRENGKLKKEQQDKVVSTIEKSINNLSVTIKSSTEEFKEALKETRQEFKHVADDIWDHIGALREEVSWITGQHEVNHKIKYDGPERRKIPRKE